MSDPTYESTGVSLATASAVVERLRAAVESTGASGFGQFAGLFHRAIPGQLALRLRPRLFRRMPAAQGVAQLDVTANLRRHAQTDSAAPHFRE